jgi:hypothetical protein
MDFHFDEQLLEPGIENLALPRNNNEYNSDSDEGKSIKADIELLCNMGFDRKMVNKVYLLLSPESIERAVDYMTVIK